MTDYTSWKSRVLAAIGDISNLDFQRRAWLKRGPEVSSFAEVINNLYDDCLFEDFLRHAEGNSGFISEESLNEMIILRDMINNYDEFGKVDSEIISDPKWIAIAKQANKLYKIIKISQ
jgi:hypothetical protein